VVNADGALYDPRGKTGQKSVSLAITIFIGHVLQRRNRIVHHAETVQYEKLFS